MIGFKIKLNWKALCVISCRRFTLGLKEEILTGQKGERKRETERENMAKWVVGRVGVCVCGGGGGGAGGVVHLQLQQL